MIKDLMILKNSYIVEYNLTDNLYLYIEGLDNFGSSINDSFDINDKRYRGVKMEILKVEKKGKYLIIKLKDTDSNIKFWVDVSIDIDSFGEKRASWEYNKYIFNNYNTQDIKEQEYQDNIENNEKVSVYLDENIDLIELLLNTEVD